VKAWESRKLEKVVASWDVKSGKCDPVYDIARTNVAPIGGYLPGGSYATKDKDVLSFAVLFCAGRFYADIQSTTRKPVSSPQEL